MSPCYLMDCQLCFSKIFVTIIEFYTEMRSKGTKCKVQNKNSWQIQNNEWIQDHHQDENFSLEEQSNQIGMFENSTEQKSGALVRDKIELVFKLSLN